MFIGKVVGTVWATKKTENVEGLRFLLVEPTSLQEPWGTDVIVAADLLGAGVGEYVLVAYGRAARLAVGSENVSIEATIIGIIDSVDVEDKDFKTRVKNKDLMDYKHGGEGRSK